MPAEYYIHNILNNPESLTSAFGGNLLQQQLNYQRDVYQTIIGSKKSAYNNLMKDAQAYEKFEEQLEKKISEELFPEHLITKNINDKLRSVGTVVNGATISVADIQQDIENMKNLLDEWINQMNKTDKYRNSTRFSEKELIDYARQINFLKEQKQKLEKWLQTGSGELLTSMTREAGNLSEVILANSLNELYSQIGNGLSTKVTGAKRGYAERNNGQRVGYRYKTSDIEITAQGMNGVMSVTLPGISLKRTTVQTSKTGQNYYEITIKNSNFRVIARTANLDINGFPLEAFYNIYANANRTAYILKDNDQGKKEPLPTITYGDLGLSAALSVLEKSLFLSSIGGNLTAKDAVEYFVVNNEIHHISEMFEDIFETDTNTNTYSMSGIASILGRTQPEIARKHTELMLQSLQGHGDTAAKARVRSARIVSAINSISLHAKLRINLTK